MRTATFLARNPAFTMDQACRALGPRASRRAVLDRLRYHVAQGRVKPLARGLYAHVPDGIDAGGFHPDPFLVAAVARDDAVLAYHSALELLGAAHSVWNEVTVFTGRRRGPLTLDGQRILFLDHPAPLARAGKRDLGLRRVERSGQLLQVTGPERSIVDGLRTLGRAGGLAELIESAAGFPVLDLDLLRRVLEAYGERVLYAATGWFLERHRRTFYVPDSFLLSLESERPKAPQYWLRRQRGGPLQRRWNLILPGTLADLQEPDEP